MASREHISYQNLFQQLLSERTVFRPLDKDKDGLTAYWACAEKYLSQVHTLYSTEPPVSTQLFLDAIDQYCSEQTADIDSIDQAALNLNLSRVYQTIDSVFSHEGFRWNEQIPDCRKVRTLFRDQKFADYVSGFRTSALEKIDEAVARINLAGREKSRLQVAFEKALRLQASYRDLLGEANRLLSEAKTAKDAAEDSAKQVSEMMEKIKGFHSSISNTESEIRRIEAEISDTESKVKTCLDAVRKYHRGIKKTSGEAQAQADSILATVLTVLGIFVAIILAFVGGFFGVLIADRIDVSPIAQVRFMYFLLIGQTLCDLLFLFLFLIARLANKSIAVLCSGGLAQGRGVPCAQCASQCKWYVRWWRKYPYIIFINCAIMFGYSFLWIWWYVDEFLFDDIPKNSPAVGVAGLLGLIVLLIGAPAFLLRRLAKGPKGGGTAGGSGSS